MGTCAGLCVNITDDPAHCGASCAACGAPANATPTCSAGSCGWTCDPGFARLGNHCANFGGVYATGNGTAGCPRTTCRTANPYTSACTCPSGFTPGPEMQVLDDSNCSGNGYGWQAMRVCWAGIYSATGSDFGGAYEIDASANCTPNPVTGGCSCPSGSTTITMPIDGSCFYRYHVYACFNASAPRSTFAGAFDKPDDGFIGHYACQAGNPASGYTCSCPGGSYVDGVRAIFGPPNGCNAAGHWGANLGFCYVP